MAQYVFTLTSRMVAITATCVVLLCLLLFLLGMQIGKLMATPTIAPDAQARPPAAAASAAPAPSSPP